MFCGNSSINALSIERGKYKGGKPEFDSTTDSNREEKVSFKRWAEENLTRFRKAECKVLHLGCNNPCCQHGLGGDEIKSGLEDKDLGVLVHENQTRANNAHLHSRRLIAPWAASQKGWPAL